jgi:hypothetical protein
MDFVPFGHTARFAEIRAMGKAGNPDPDAFGHAGAELVATFAPHQRPEIVESVLLSAMTDAARTAFRRELAARELAEVR